MEAAESLTEKTAFSLFLFSVLLAMFYPASITHPSSSSFPLLETPEEDDEPGRKASTGKSETHMEKRTEAERREDVRF